jgi:hypothetical protein
MASSPRRIVSSGRADETIRLKSQALSMLAVCGGGSPTSVPRSFNISRVKSAQAAKPMNLSVPTAD